MVARILPRTLPAAGFALLATGLWANRDRVVVTPRCLTLQPGQTCTFQARCSGDPVAGTGPGRPARSWRWSLADGGEGAIQEATGVYTAPHVTEVKRIRVRATALPEGDGEPAVPGEAAITVLPAQPFDLVAKVLGPGWLEPFCQEYPFLDLATLQRFPGTGSVRGVETLPQQDKIFLATGYGLPVDLRWQPAATAMAQLLSFREGDQLVRRDVTGQTAQTLSFRAPVRDCAVETLDLAAEGEGLWISRSYPFQVDVRGVFPFAGNPLTAEDHADGRGLSARFREAFALVWLWQRDDETRTWGLFHVSDPRTHVLRVVNQEGRVSTLCGEPGQPGHQDSPGHLQRLRAWLRGAEAPSVRFNRPTYLTRREVPERRDRPRPWSWETLVADSGNHVLRRVDAAGTVATLAGVPGQAGHRDDPDPLAALFHDPQGISADSRSRVYVADRGNHVIRRIAPDGVTTLAGSPGQPGALDGVAGAARFTDLKGMAWAPSTGPDGDLFVLDGHAVRRISLEDRVVTTLVGQVDRPGFLDVGPAQGAAALRQPCLRDPVGICHERTTLLLADRGNHAIRRAHLRDPVLCTLVGDPAAPEDRPGLARDGIPGPLGPAYAALAAPTAVMPGTHGTRDSLMVCSGRAVVEFHDRVLARDAPSLTVLDIPPVRRDEPVVVRFSLLADNPNGEPTLRAFRYAVDFLDPSGELAARCQGEGSSLAPVAAQGTFTASGEGTVLVQCCTDQGVSAGARVKVIVGEN